MAVVGDSVQLQYGSITSVKVHPLVLFAITDHFMRRTEQQKRVLGLYILCSFMVCLLHAWSHGGNSTQELSSASVARVWHISSTLSRSGTPKSRLEKSGPTWILTHIWRNYTNGWTTRRTLLGGTFSHASWPPSCCVLTSSKFRPAGRTCKLSMDFVMLIVFCCFCFRYTTSIDSKDVNFNSCVMHRFYEQEVKEGGGGHSAVHLVMDPSLDDGKVSIRAYISKNIKLGDILQFQEIPVEVVATPAERVGGRVLAVSLRIYPHHQTFAC